MKIVTTFKNLLFASLIYLQFVSGTVFAAVCTITDSADPHYYQVTAPDQTGKSTIVYWSKTLANVDSDAGKIRKFSNTGEGDGEVNHDWKKTGIFTSRIYPVLKDGTIVTDERTLDGPQIDRTKTSEAVFACEKEGAHLATANDFFMLQRCFESYKGYLSKGYLTSKGAAQLFEKFPEFQSARYLWTSTTIYYESAYGTLNSWRSLARKGKRDGGYYFTTKGKGIDLGTLEAGWGPRESESWSTWLRSDKWGAECIKRSL